MSVVVVVTAFPVPEHRAAVISAFEAAILQSPVRACAVRDPASYHSRPGSRVLISWSSHPLPSGSLNEA